MWVYKYIHICINPSPTRSKITISCIYMSITYMCVILCIYIFIYIYIYKMKSDAMGAQRIRFPDSALSDTLDGLESKNIQNQKDNSGHRKQLMQRQNNEQIVIV